VSSIVRQIMTIAVLVAAAGSACVHAASDPLEPINRPIFAVNDVFDRYALRPVARVYDFLMPAPAQRGVNNFFANLYDVTNALNSALQWRWGGAFESGGRVLLNSTFGIVGLFDVATPMGLERHTTDFGHTLALWGVPSGPYVVLPLLGPRTVRSGTAILVDTFALSVPPYLDDRSIRNTLWLTELVHIRSQFLESDALVTGDRYIFFRDAYLQNRAALVNDGEVVDDFSDFDESWDEEF
jgi:phospholipid-binding lipoprotein MlaA